MLRYSLVIAIGIFLSAGASGRLNAQTAPSAIHKTNSQAPGPKGQPPKPNYDNSRDQIEAQKKLIAALEAENAALRAKIKDLESQLKK